MSTNRNPITDSLLGQLPNPSEISDYGQRVSRALAEDHRRIKRQRVAVTLFWVFCAASATAWLWFSDESAHLPRAPFLACIFFIWGGVEMVKHHINSSRIDVLTEIKQVQVQIFNLEQRVADRTAGKS